MKIVITGSNSFLAKYFRHFSKIKKKNLINLTTSTVQENFNSDEKFIVCKSLYRDIEKKLRYEKVDTIIHFASLIPKTFDKADYALFNKNTEMMNNLFKFSINKKIKRFIYISSFGSMNTPKLLDIKDFYTMSKITGEHFCSMLNAKNIKAVSLRISAPYGEFSKSKSVINIFIKNALKNKDILVYGNGKREQNFTYAGDIIFALELILKKRISGVYEIVSDKNISMLKLANLIKKITNSKSKIILNKQKDLQESYKPSYNYNKALKDFGYKPKFNIKSGLENYINWCLK